jgi:YD repeat-containing protein
MTQWQSADGQETLQYRYDGSNRLSGITAIDGAVTTFVYSSGQVLIETVNSRVTTLTLSTSTNNLTEITDPDSGVQTLTYDSNNHLTEQQLGLLEDNWAYSSAGVLATYTWGALSVGGVSNGSHYTYKPMNAQGLRA